MGISEADARADVDDIGDAPAVLARDGNVLVRGLATFHAGRTSHP